MFFNINKNFLLTLSVLSILVLHGCGLNVSENKPEEKPVVIQSTTCLEDAINQIKLMAKGEGVEAEISKTMNCLSDTVQSFSTNIQGNNKGYFTPSEISYFLNKNVIKSENKITDDFMSEIMKFKVALIGGSNESLQKSELRRLIEIIQSLTPELIKLNPHLKIITQNWDYTALNQSQKDFQFNKAKKALNEFSKFIGYQFTKTYTEYEATSLLDLLEKAMIYAESSNEQIAHVEKYKNIAIQVKSNLINRGQFIKSSDWPIVTKVLSETLFFILRTEYYGKNYNTQFNLRPENDISKLSYLIDDIAVAVADVLEMQNDRTATYEQIVPLFNEVFKTFDIDVIFDIEILKDIYALKNATSHLNFPAETKGWGKNDFRELHGKIDIFFHELGIILSEVEIMSKDETWKKDYKTFVQFENMINLSISKIAPLFISKYDFKKLRSFLLNLNTSGLISQNDFIKDYDKYYNSILALKNIINTTSGSIANGNELTNILITASQGLFNYLEYKNFVHIYKLDQIEFNQNALLLIDKVKSTLKTVLDLNKNHYLATDGLISTYRTLAQDFELKKIMSDDSMRTALNLMWSNFLISPTERLSGLRLSGFNADALNNLHFWVQRFLITNKLTLLALNGRTSFLQSELVDLLNIQISKTSAVEEVHILNEMKLALNSSVPLALEKDYLKILDTKGLIYNKKTVDLSNISRLASRLLIRSLTLKQAVLNQTNNSQIYSNSALTLDELQSFFEIARPVIVDLDLIADDNLKFMKKRFLEADLFVPRSNGNNLADFYEIHDLIIHIVGGTARANKVKDQIVTNCLNPSEAPFKRKTEIPEFCLLEVYRQFNEGFDFIPSYTNLKFTFDENRFHEYSMNLLLAAGHVENEHKTVTLENADNYPHIVQYIEMMYAKFDGNRDGLLDKTEALAAFPLFKNTLQTVVASMDGGDKIKEEELPGVFIYFLKYGRGPKGPVEKLQFKLFINNDKKWDIQTDRFALGLVFKFISSSN